MATASKQKWWKNSIVYQIYPRSFCDSNGDGIGDIPGIISRLHYLKELGVDILLLNPIFPSPGFDKGYDISDYRAINPEIGTMEDMERLISRAKRMGIKIILDISINFTSVEHEWFKKALEGDEKYKNYYFFRKREGMKKPNNWSSFYGGNVWTNTDSGEAYLHLFGKNQPDLNWSNPEVYNEIADIMRFWMDKGIAGFRLDSINVVYKNSLEKGKLSRALTGHEHYLNTEGCHNILRRLNADVWSNYKSFVVGETVLTSPEEAKLLCDDSRNELDAVFFYGRIDAESKAAKRFRKEHNPNKIVRLVDKGQSIIDYPVNYLETSENANYVKFFTNNIQKKLYFEKLLTGLNLSLKGLPFISEGETGVDPQNIEDKDSLSSFYSKMIEFRKNSKALSEGMYRRIAAPNDVFVFTREAPEERLYIYCNFSAFNKSVELYGDRIIFNNYEEEVTDDYSLRPYEFRIVVSNI